MKVCGIELKSNEARILVVEGDLDTYDIINSSKFSITESKDQQVVKQFRIDILEFLHSQELHAIGIKERITKGRFSGGALSFKMEGLIQTCEKPVQLVHNMSIKSALKELDIDFSRVKKYQEEAFKVAIYLLKTST